MGHTWKFFFIIMNCENGQFCKDLNKTHVKHWRTLDNCPVWGFPQYEEEERQTLSVTGYAVVFYAFLIIIICTWVYHHVVLQFCRSFSRMASTEEYSRSVLRVSVAQICQNLGWNATQTSPLELMTDVLERYLEEIAKISHRYSEQCKYSEPTDR